MSRMQVGVFLSKAKKSLQSALSQKTSATFVIGNESADLDSIMGSIVYGYIMSSTPQALSRNHTVIPITNIPAADLALRPELTALLKFADLKPSDLITLDDLGSVPMPLSQTAWTLVDHNVLQGELGRHYRDKVTGVVDHHDDENVVPKTAEPRLIEKTGSCCSHIALYCRKAWESTDVLTSRVGVGYGQNDILIDDFAYSSTWDAQVAKLALGAILIDTVNMTATDKITEVDRKAVRYLEALINISRKLGKDYDRDAFFEQVNDAKGHLDGLSVDDILRKDYKEWVESDVRLGISSSVKSLGYLKDKSQNLVSDVESFVQRKKLDMFAIMTAFSDEQGRFTREILLYTPNQSKAKVTAERFATDAVSELQLQDISSRFSLDVHAGHLDIWDQKNLKASRKRVAPLLREFIRKDNPKSAM